MNNARLRRNSDAKHVTAEPAELMMPRESKLPSGPLTTEAHHGGIDLQWLQSRGIQPDSITDLSSNILPVEHPQRVREEIARASLSAYPDRDSLALRTALHESLEVDAAQILVGNGCCELIHLTAEVLVTRDSSALIIGPTFSEYSRACRMRGAQVEELRASSEDGFKIPIEAISKKLKNQYFETVWLCNPNNPTGQAIDAEQLKQWIISHPRTIFLIDESYIEFSNSLSSLVNFHAANLVVLRSMTKCYALAGLRLGYLIAQPKIIERLKTQRVPWSVNAIAQAAGVAVLKNQSHYETAMNRLQQESIRLIGELRELGCQTVPSETGFFLMSVVDVDKLQEHLLKHYILVRDCRSFGLAHYVRIAVGDQTANTQLIGALQSFNFSEVRQSCDVLEINPPDEHTESRKRSADPEPTWVPWGDSFREQLHELFRLRRDVRRFKTDPLPSGALERWIEAACLAPSVGLSEPWRFISVRSSKIRERIVEEFETQNALAAETYDIETAEHYLSLKLAGLREAPEQLAIFVDPETPQGRRLGRKTMPETLEYSVVAAIQNLWLAARAENVGVGWVSILRPDTINTLLGVPPTWKLIAYLCIGYPLEEIQAEPELQRHQWESRASSSRLTTL